MGEVVVYSSVSVDGFIADENERAKPVFDWLSSGDVPLDESGEVNVSQTSYDYVAVTADERERRLERQRERLAEIRASQPDRRPETPEQQLLRVHAEATWSQRTSRPLDRAPRYWRRALMQRQPVRIRPLPALSTKRTPLYVVFPKTATTASMPSLTGFG